MDCKTAQLLLELARPRPTELDPTEAEALDNHLIDCPTCARLARDERRLDDALGRAMREVTLPVGGPDRLLAQLAANARQGQRRRFGRAAWSLAAAAVLLISVIAGAYFDTRVRSIDLFARRDRDQRFLINPQPAQVAEWLRDEKIAVPAPEQFDFRFLAHYGMDRLEGRPVAMLLFTRPNDNGNVYQARVYLLDARQFDLAALAPLPSSGCSIDIVRHPTDPRFAYLVVHNAPGVEAFLVNESIQLSAT